VILSTADIDAALWTNKQYMADQLSRHHSVVYVESMGLRNPSLSRSDLARICRKLKRVFFRRVSLGSKRDVPFEVVSPRVLPFHGVVAVRKLNAHLLRRQLHGRFEGRGPTVLWTFSPLTYGLENLADSTVYHSVDLLHTFPGVPVEALLAGEETLVQSADKVIASSRPIRDHLRRVGGESRPILLWENVADVELMSHQDDSSRESRAVFAGNLTEAKVDFDILISVAESGLPLVLAGPIGIDGTGEPERLRRLFSFDNVSYVGLLNARELAALLNTCTVGLIPYLVNEHTRGIFPMKVYEYLAAGLAVVSTALPSLVESEVSGLQTVARPIYVETVTRACVSSAKEVQDRRAVAASHSWTERGKQANALVKDLVGGA
jgi:glycosyltransferase involved in cell wall biosynthesis